MALYAVVMENHNIGLIAARSPSQAYREACADEGSLNVLGVRKATPDDLSWNALMGGRLPDDPYRKATA